MARLHPFIFLFSIFIAFFSWPELQLPSQKKGMLKKTFTFYDGAC